MICTGKITLPVGIEYLSTLLPSRNLPYVKVPRCATLTAEKFSTAKYSLGQVAICLPHLYRARRRSESGSAVEADRDANIQHKAAWPPC